MKKSRLNVVALSFVGLASMALAACGGNGGDSTSGGKESSSSIDGTSIVNGLTQDLEFDESNKPIFDNVTINMWSIIGSPDDVVFKKLINQFNQEYLGQINLNVTYIGHFDFYNSLDTTWQNDPDNAPEVCFMHNEKTTEYAYKGYLYPLVDEFFNRTKVNFDFTKAYENIDRVTQYNGTRYAIPVDGHGFVTQFRQDIIKKNGLGFDGNTRFIPESYEEYQTLLTSLREKADAGSLLIRNINKGENHAWKAAVKDGFYPEFTQSTDPDGLSALYANGGTMASADHKTVTFQNNEGFKSYITDQVDRWNGRLMGENGTNTESFGLGNTCVFSEGPWWIAQTYTPNWNNSELRNVNPSLGVSQDDVDNYSYPLASSHPVGWWTLPSSSSETAKKWYGNGHAISFTKRLTSLTKMAAALTFAKWYTQGVNSETNIHHLTTWAMGGHVPAWKNVYESDDYTKEAANNVTLKALGKPADIIAMEDLPFESTIFTGLSNCIVQVQSALKSDAGCTKEKALQFISDVAGSTQDSLNLLLDA